MTTANVLIPLDGSPFSRAILEHVERVFDPHGTTVTLLRVGEQPQAMIFAAPPAPVPLAGVGPGFGAAVRLEPIMTEAIPAEESLYLDQAIEEEQAQLEDELRADVQRLRAQGFTVRLAVRFGDPAEEIIRCVEQEPIGLVAMTTHGRTGLAHFVMGSAAEQVLRHVRVPVLMFRPAMQ